MEPATTTLIDALLQLSDRDLEDLALALRSGRLAPPFAAVAIRRLLSRQLAPRVAGALQQLAAAGFGAGQIAFTLDLLREDRRRPPRLEQVVDVVTTGPDVVGAASRDTSVVVRELFTHARESVLVAGHMVYQGHRVFQALADRMLERRDLQVRLFLDIQRSPGDAAAASVLVSRFADRFRRHQWPRDRPLPEIYFDPRSLGIDGSKRASLHAQVGVVDGVQGFVSSANFTEAAQLRNIEVGVVIRSEPVAAQVTAFFDVLLRTRNLEPVRISS